MKAGVHSNRVAGTCFDTQPADYATKLIDLEHNGMLLDGFDF